MFHRANKPYYSNLGKPSHLDSSDKTVDKAGDWQKNSTDLCDKITTNHKYDPQKTSSFRGK